MARLYDEIHVENNIKDEKKNHDLNVFLARLLFCFFAEDTNIFDDKLFTNSIASHTQTDGSDFGSYLDNLFEVLNTKERSKFPEYLKKFPYVNGGLFAKKHWIPKFTSRSRKIIIECGELNWSKINPDIFGSMMQAVVQSNERGSLGMHYTSVPNIMKVIEPLFLDNLKEEFEKNKGNMKKLQQLIYRISHIKFFDPACGSGNFLIITYKELRRLEMEIIKELGMFAFSCINLSQFYGIEIDDFAHEISKLSLYLAEHQMNIEFLQEFGRVNPTLPLKTGGNIICANACRIDWNEVCPKNIDDEIYILGNPPYIGARMQDKVHKKDIDHVFKGIKKYKDLDYIACWFYLASKYILEVKARYALVSTNSICQGEQVALLWPLILNLNLEIYFAYTSFKWSNSAKLNAGVTVIIVGVMNKQKNTKKVLYSSNLGKTVNNINPYLSEGQNIIVHRMTTPLYNLPEMKFGNMPNDGGALILNSEEKQNIENSYPQSRKYFRQLLGSLEFLRGSLRWCLWIQNSDINEVMKIPPIVERIERVKKHRLESKDIGTKKLAERSHQFRDLNVAKHHALIIPRVSSERREYIPIGMIDNSYIISDSAQAIYDCDPWVLGVISSKIHMVWIKTVCGSLETRIRYSSALGYNTFPIPSLSIKQKGEIKQYVFNILEEREKHSEKTIADIYDPEKMPDGLKEAHHFLDLSVERCYRSKPFANDEERLEYLFKLYEQMIRDNKLLN